MGGYHPKYNNLGIVRKKVAQAKINLINGIDPLEQKRAEKLKIKTKAVSDSLTFEYVSLEYIKTKRAEWKNAKHNQQWINTLNKYAFPIIGKIPVSSIETSHILAILKPIWLSKTETATRVRARIEAILSYAEAHKWRSEANPARWRGHLSVILPSPQKLKNIKHHAALPYSDLPDLPDFMRVLLAIDGMGAKALLVAILTATRTSEVLHANWTEIDLDQGIWIIPKNRMKAGVEHRIPLCNKVINLLKLLKSQRVNDWVFPNLVNGHHLSSAGMSSVLKRIGRTDITVHGFRSTFRDYIAEKTNFSSRLAEAALSHKLKNKVEAAYQRGDLIEKRKELMEVWADYCLQYAS
jgi:integrase